jgi:hypothetical protein
MKLLRLLSLATKDSIVPISAGIQTVSPPFLNLVNEWVFARWILIIDLFNHLKAIYLNLGSIGFTNIPKG